ncbi:unnamed protein product [Rotaria sp. Silwood1]|nr:unnamed protein product [Rotaria sp. Silwood1]
MSQSCSIINCILTSRGLCDCCQQYLCLKHLIEHNASLITQLSPLTDEIIALEDRLKTLNIQKIIDNSCEKLEEWRQACHKKIDSYFEQKCEEINQFVNERVNQQQEELNRLQLKITKLINVQETTRLDIGLLTSTIHQLERNINNIDQTHFTINTCPLVIDDTLVHIKKTAEHELDLSTLSSVYRTIHRPEGSFRPFTVNDRYFLIHQHPNICLFDQEMNIVNQTLWSYGGILDIYWSSTLDRFIVIGEKNMFLINENTMLINSVHTIAEQNWKSCTCSDTILFASTTEWGSSIMEFTLFPVIELIRERKCPLTCEKTIEHGLDLLTLSPVYRTINYPKGSFISLAGNDRCLLIHQHPNLCLLDREMNIVKQTLWSYTEIWDMCWSSILDRFIVLGKNNIYLINDNTMSIDDVHKIKGRVWVSYTCSEIALFASTNERASSIMEFALLPAIKLTRE